MVGGLFEDDESEFGGVGDIAGGEVSEAQGAFIESDPPSGAGAGLVLFQDEGAVISMAHVGEAGELSLEPLEKMEHALALVGEGEL